MATWRARHQPLDRVSYAVLAEERGKASGDADALVAVVFAAAAAESALNEMSEASLMPDVFPTPPEIERLAEVVRGHQSARWKSTGERYRDMYRALSGQHAASRAVGYGDFSKLVELRYDLLHLKLDHLHSAL